MGGARISISSGAFALALCCVWSPSFLLFYFDVQKLTAVWAYYSRFSYQSGC